MVCVTGMVINIRYMNPEIEKRLRHHIYTYYDISKKGMLTRVIEEAVLFYLENIESYNDWKYRQ
tara:strand:+ start:3992 stop:4183 length:192 start_codon:yes stop_codon:yes gene_type:complete